MENRKNIKDKKIKGEETVFLRWLNRPKKFDSWVKASDIETPANGSRLTSRKFHEQISRSYT